MLKYGIIQIQHLIVLTVELNWFCSAACVVDQFVITLINYCVMTEDICTMYIKWTVPACNCLTDYGFSNYRKLRNKLFKKLTEAISDTTLSFADTYDSACNWNASIDETFLESVALSEC